MEGGGDHTATGDIPALTTTGDDLAMTHESTRVGNVVQHSFANVITTESIETKVNFKKVEAVGALNGEFEAKISVSSVMEVNERLRNSVYGYFIGKRIAFLVVENYVFNAWGKFGIQKVMMNAKGFYFFKFSSKKGAEDVLGNGPWMIRAVPIILSKWSPSTSLTKENQTRVPVWVKMHDVPLAAFTADGLSIIASKIGNPLILDSYSSTTCKDSWGRSSYARAMIEIDATSQLKESVTVVVPDLEGDGYTCEKINVEYEWKPPHCITCKTFCHASEACPKKNVEVPKKNVEVQDDGYQVVKSRNKGKKPNDTYFAVKQKPNLAFRQVPYNQGTWKRKNDAKTSTSNPFSVLANEGPSGVHDENNARTVGSIQQSKVGKQDKSDDDDIENVYDETNVTEVVDNPAPKASGASTPIEKVPNV